MDKLLEYAKTTNVMDNLYAVTLPDTAVLTILAFGMGMYILYIYRRIYSGAMFSGTFAVCLVALSMITTTLVLAVTSNLMLSLGMVGALSIIRFRTAIKDPMEIVFLFWSIETGIVLASGVILTAVFINLAIGGVLLLLVKQKPDYPYILVVCCKSRAVAKLEELLNEYTNSYIVRSRKIVSRTDPKAQVSNQQPASESDTPLLPGNELVEMDIEVILKTGDNKDKTNTLKETEFVDKLSTEEPGILKAILVTYNGGYMT